MRLLGHMILGLVTSALHYRLTRLLSMSFFCRGEVAPLALSVMVKKNIDLKVVSKLVLKQLLDYDGSGDM